jgi:hypothetical protein
LWRALTLLNKIVWSAVYTHIATICLPILALYLLFKPKAKDPLQQFYQSSLLRVFCQFLDSHASQRCTELCALGFKEAIPTTTTINRLRTPSQNKSYCISPDIDICTQPSLTDARLHGHPGESQ